VTILLMGEIVEHRARKAQELAFYTEQKERLERKLTAIRCELNLTDRILDLIRREKLIEVQK
jgi:hypothetical protein